MGAGLLWYKDPPFPTVKSRISDRSASIRTAITAVSINVIGEVDETFRGPISRCISAMSFSTSDLCIVYNGCPLAIS